MAFRLPPLNAVRVFEAAGRHESFKRAAEELSLTPSAVSHAVQVLEGWVGGPLFERRTRGIALTPAGRLYLAPVTQALERLADATARLPGRRPTGTLSITVAPSFSARWLMPRLGGFTAAHPELVVTIDTVHQSLDLPRSGVDLAIRRAARSRPGGTWVRLMRERAVPLCSPSLLPTCPDPLARAPRLLTTSADEDWTPWGGAAGADRPPPLRFDTMQMALAAAGQGLGVALGCTPVVDDDLAAGRLVPLAAAPRPTGRCYWLVGRDGTFERPEVKLFRRWLLRELGLLGELGLLDRRQRPAQDG